MKFIKNSSRTYSGTLNVPVESYPYPQVESFVIGFLYLIQNKMSLHCLQNIKFRGLLFIVTEHKSDRQNRVQYNKKMSKIKKFNSNKAGLFEGSSFWGGSI